MYVDLGVHIERHYGKNESCARIMSFVLRSEHRWRDIGRALILAAEEQLHKRAEKSRRSRSAAKSSAARMSLGKGFGKSARISSCNIPEARYFRMSWTVIRVPRK